MYPRKKRIFCFCSIEELQQIKPALYGFGFYFLQCLIVNCRRIKLPFGIVKRIEERYDCVFVLFRQ